MSKFRKGLITKIYDDWQTQTGAYNEGELIEKVSDGLPFILSESACPTKQRVYSYEVWKVKVDKHVRVVKLAFLLKRGKASNNEKPNYRTGIDDSFIKINGKSVF